MKVVVDSSAVTPLLFLLGCEKIGHLSNGAVSYFEYHIETWTYNEEIIPHVVGSTFLKKVEKEVKDAALINHNITKIYSELNSKYPKLEDLIDELKRNMVLNIDSIEDTPCTSFHFDCRYIKEKIMEDLNNKNVRRNKGELCSYLLAILIQAKLLLIIDYSATNNILEKFKVTLKSLNLGKGSVFPWDISIGDFVVLLELLSSHTHENDLIKIINLLSEYFEIIALTRSNASVIQKNRLQKFKSEILPKGEGDR